MSEWQYFMAFPTNILLLHSSCILHHDIPWAMQVSRENEIQVSYLELRTQPSLILALEPDRSLYIDHSSLQKGVSVTQDESHPSLGLQTSIFRRKSSSVSH